MRYLLLDLVVLAGCAASTSSTSSTTTATVPTTTTFDVTIVHAPTYYTINGLNNPILNVKRGTSYTFNISASGHPFYIMSSPGTDIANAYSSGVTNNGAQTGAVIFTVPSDAPDTLYYDCSVHSTMTGTIRVSN